MDLSAADLVYAHLPRGKDAALSIGALAEKMKRPRREVEQAVQALRVSGFAVASGSEGVWIGSAKDMRATAAMLIHRIGIQRKTLDAVEATARRLEGTQQLPLAWKEVA